VTTDGWLCAENRDVNRLGHAVKNESFFVDVIGVAMIAMMAVLTAATVL